MPLHLTPARQRGIEVLDAPDVDSAVMRRSMRDVTRANDLLGGRRAAIRELLPALARQGATATLLDVGSGRGDIADAAEHAAASVGVRLLTVRLDSSVCLLAEQHRQKHIVVGGDALHLPFRDSSVDLVLASQVVHHFDDARAVELVREMNRVARSRVVISDLRRSLIAAAGLWLGSFPLRFHPVSRHDGVVSVMRGFLPFELADIVEKATGIRPVVSRRLGFRLTASWSV